MGLNYRWLGWIGFRRRKGRKRNNRKREREREWVCVCVSDRCVWVVDVASGRCPANSIQLEGAGQDVLCHNSRHGDGVAS